jgi:hypothetical protein
MYSTCGTAFLATDVESMYEPNPHPCVPARARHRGRESSARSFMHLQYSTVWRAYCGYVCAPPISTDPEQSPCAHLSAARHLAPARFGDFSLAFRFRFSDYSINDGLEMDFFFVPDRDQTMRLAAYSQST